MRHCGALFSFQMSFTLLKDADKLISRRQDKKTMVLDGAEKVNLRCLCGMKMAIAANKHCGAVIV